VTHLRDGGVFYYLFPTNLLLSLLVKVFWQFSTAADRTVRRGSSCSAHRVLHRCRRSVW